MRRALMTAALALGGIPSACAFVLDFDELQAGSEQPGSDAAIDGKECNCVSDDPCRPKVCQEGQCVEQPVVGLAYDGYHATLAAEKVHRLTLVTRGSSFYGSVFYEDTTPRLRFFKTGFNDKQDGGEPAGGKLTNELGGVVPALADPTVIPASAAGLADIGDSVLAVFGTTTGGVFYLRLDTELTPLTGSGAAQTATDPYDTADPKRHPHAWTAGANAFIGWITTNGIVHIPTSAVPLTFGSGNVTAFAPLLSAGGAAIVWQEQGIYAKHQDQTTPLPLADCPEIAGWTHFFVSSFGLSNPVRAGNIAVWTKTNGGMWKVQSRSVGCSANDCIVATATPQCPDDVGSDLRTFAALAVKIPEQESFYQVFAGGVEISGERQVVLEAAVVDPVAKTSEPLGTTIALTKPAPIAESGDWPALAFSGGDKILVGWVQSGSGIDEAHLQRYRLCLPPE